MTDDDASKIFKLLADDWVKAMDREDFDDAIATSISAYLIMRGKKNEKLATSALAFVHPAISSLLMTDGSTAPGKCSFCGRGDLHLHTGTGIFALICSACVRRFAKQLDAEDQ